MPQSKVTSLFTCTTCTTVYKRKEAAFKWIAGEQVFTDTCWRCYDKGKYIPVMVRPRIRHDDLHSSWGHHRGSGGAHGRLRH